MLLSHFEKPHLVVALAYDKLCTFEFGVTVEIFALPRPEFDFTWYDFKVAGCDEIIRAMGGFKISVDAGLELFESADTIIIPGWRDLGEPPSPPLIEALQKAHQRGIRLVSICSGVFLLAAAGLLHEKRVTTHWRHAKLLQKAYPSLTFVNDVLYVDEGNIVTSAGSSAGIDACLHLIRTDYGAKIANDVARRLVMPAHREGGQAQYISALIGAECHYSLAKTLEWIRSNLQNPLTIKALAHQANLSERTFLRRFFEGTATTPLKWIRQERISMTMNLLEITQLPLIDIAEKSGFQSLENFRKTFQAHVKLTPTAYRKRFTQV